MMIKTQKDHKDHVRVKGIIIIKGVGPSWFGKSSSPLFGGNCPQVNLSLCLCLWKLPTSELVFVFMFVIMCL